MRVGLAVHGWYHPLMNTDTYIISMERALQSVGLTSSRILGHTLPNGTVSQLIFPSILRYFMNYGNDKFDIIHDTRGDSVFRNVDVSTIQDLYWNHHKNNFTDKLIQTPIAIYQNYRRTLKLSRRIIITNSYIKRELVTIFGLKNDNKIRVIPIPFEYKLDARKDDIKYDVIWVGTSDRRKQLPVFIECISNLPKSYKIGIRATYINRFISDDIQNINNKIKMLQYNGWNIEMLKFNKLQDSMNNLYASSKCLVSTSSYEGFHMPVAEAYLRGTHVVIPQNELYTSIYGTEAEGIHYYTNKQDIGLKISEAIQYGRFKPDRKIVEYLSFKHVGLLLKEVYEEAMKH